MDAIDNYFVYMSYVYIYIYFNMCTYMCVYMARLRAAPHYPCKSPCGRPSSSRDPLVGSPSMAALQQGRRREHRKADDSQRMEPNPGGSLQNRHCSKFKSLYSVVQKNYRTSGIVANFRIGIFFVCHIWADSLCGAGSVAIVFVRTNVLLLFKIGQFFWFLEPPL